MAIDTTDVVNLDNMCPSAKRAGLGTLLGAGLSAAEVDVLDGVTAGTASANKAVVLDASKDIAGINALGAATPTFTGAVTLSAASGNALTFSGTAANCINASATPTNAFLKVDASGNGGVVLGSMTFKSPETDPEAGYIKVDVAGTAYEVPIYATA